MKGPANPNYTRHHPRWHRRRLPIFWWVHKRSYMGFIVRELTSLAVAYVAFLLLVAVWVMGRGEAAREAFVGWLARPAVMGAHLVVVLALVLHALTWFHLAPKAMRLRVGSWRVPAGLVLGLHYAGWVLVSAGVVVLLGVGVGR